MHVVGKAVKDLPFSFSSQYRLVSKHDFQSVFAESRKVTRKHFFALYRSNQLSHARVGIIVAKHRIKLAVERNRLRRLVRESFRHHKEVLKGLDIIVLMRSECTPLDNKALRDDIDNLWQQLLASSSRGV